MGDISVILNVYKRPYNLNKQIEAVLNQFIEIEPTDIHVWYNPSDVPPLEPINKQVNTYKSSWNTKFWGRFTLPLLVDTKYVAIFDDDVLPQSNWFSNCVNSIEKQDGIYGGSGVILKTKSYSPNSKVGWNGIHSNEIKRVDLVGHAWFFRQEHTKYLYMEKPFDRRNGEDIMFSYLAQKYGNIDTFVPPHPESDRSLWCTDPSFAASHGMSKEAHSIANISTHIGQRNNICIQAINNGWKTVNGIK